MIYILETVSTLMIYCQNCWDEIPFHSSLSVFSLVSVEDCQDMGEWRAGNVISM